MEKISRRLLIDIRLWDLMWKRFDNGISKDKPKSLDEFLEELETRYKIELINGNS